MKINICIIICLLCCLSQSALAQTNETELVIRDTINRDTVSLLKKNRVDPLSPSKAAFYSAVLPGLGQAYNKKYWKIPIVYAALGTGIYFYASNNKQYNRYRTAYKRRLAGLDDEFQTIVPNNDALIDAQEFYQRNRDLSLLLTVVAYVLNIVDANVDAHLLQFNVNDDLSLRPHIDQNHVDFNRNLGVTLNFRF